MNNSELFHCLDTNMITNMDGLAGPGLKALPINNNNNVNKTSNIQNFIYLS